MSDLPFDGFAAAHAAGAQARAVDAREAAEYNTSNMPGPGSVPMGGPPDRPAEAAKAQPPTIIPIETPTLGDRSYVVHDGEVAFVVDPQRDIDRVLDIVADEGVRITHVFETHIHNDYITGGLALALHTGAGYFVNGADEVAYDRTPIADGDEVAVGASMRLRALATPGHTFTHLSYALAAGGEPVAVFTGGSMLYGTTGRPDLLGPEHTHDLVHAQYASAHRLAAELPDATAVFPTHGFGSFCSATKSEATDSTIGREKQSNPALTAPEETYVSELLAGLDTYPAYYVHMAPANAAGPTAPDLSLPSMARPEELRRRIEAGEWVVDLRSRTVFAAGHVPGTLNFGLDGGFATYLGWLIEWGTPLTLLGETEADVAGAQRELVRIGIDRPAAAATGGPEDWSDRPLASFRQATFADLDQVRHHREVVILDVRRQSEFSAARIEGALNIPLHELPKRVNELPTSAELWVHCAGGYRASVAASFLSAANRQLVAIDDTFDNAELTGLHLISQPTQDAEAGPA